MKTNLDLRLKETILKIKDNNNHSKHQKIKKHFREQTKNQDDT